MHCFPVTLFCFPLFYDFQYHSSTFFCCCYFLTFSSTLPQSFQLPHPQFLFLPFNSLCLKPSFAFSYLLSFQPFFFCFNFQFLLVPNFPLEQHRSFSPSFCFLFFFSSIPFPSFVGFSCKLYSLFSFCLSFPHLSFYPVFYFLSISCDFQPFSFYLLSCCLFPVYPL